MPLLAQDLQVTVLAKLERSQQVLTAESWMLFVERFWAGVFEQDTCWEELRERNFEHLLGGIKGTKF